MLSASVMCHYFAKIGHAICLHRFSRPSFPYRIAVGCQRQKEDTQNFRLRKQLPVISSLRRNNNLPEAESCKQLKRKGKKNEREQSQACLNFAE